MRRVAAFFLATLAASAAAVDTPTWPPPGDVAQRMRELQLVIGSPQSTAAQRDTAREELSGLLKSPAEQLRGRTRDEKSAPRAAIEPIGPIVKPAVNPSVPMPGVATVEVIAPPRITVMPQTGAVPAPSGRAAIDPRTGNVLHETPNGYIDPRTGQFTPR
ncbi:MAG: hypothetical protein H7Y14_11960 [Burkholderiales bacterium]|nr:hypothetical protein [Burkholderiales bacterium]